MPGVNSPGASTSATAEVADERGAVGVRVALTLAIPVLVVALSAAGCKSHDSGLNTFRAGADNACADYVASLGHPSPTTLEEQLHALRKDIRLRTHMIAVLARLETPRAEERSVGLLRRSFRHLNALEGATIRALKRGRIDAPPRLDREIGATVRRAQRLARGLRLPACVAAAPG